MRAIYPQFPSNLAKDPSKPATLDQLNVILTFQFGKGNSLQISDSEKSKLRNLFDHHTSLNLLQHWLKHQMFKTGRFH